MIAFAAIGYAHTPHKESYNTPIQPSSGRGIQGTIEIMEEYVEGLKDLDGFSHIILLFHLHKSEGYTLQVTPFLDDQLRGVFSTRAPRRPNPIGLSVVKLNRIEDNILHIEDVDLLEGTPILDIKPYVPDFEPGVPIRKGWLEGKQRKTGITRDDGRFDGS